MDGLENNDVYNNSVKKMGKLIYEKAKVFKSWISRLVGNVGKAAVEAGSDVASLGSNDETKVDILYENMATWAKDGEGLT